MKALTLILSFFVHVLTNGQTSYDSEFVLRERELEFSLVEGSQLIIQGETNVNSFDCSFNDPNYFDQAVFIGSVLDKRITFSKAILHLPVNDLDCGSTVMNKDLMELLQADQFPEITVKFSEVYWHIETLWKEKTNKDNPIGYFNVRLSIAGVERSAKINIYTTIMDRGKKVLSTTGVIDMDMREFGLEPPTKFLGMVKVKETLNILIDLNFSWKEK